MTHKNRIILAGILTVLFLLFLILVKTVDVAAIGPNGTEIGFSALNAAVHEATGIRLGWYRLTEVFGVLAILAAAGLALIGLLQWIIRKKLFQVDAEILTAGLLFLVTIVLYILFEKIIVNYRPIIMPGETEPEASFPSSHTVLIIVVMGTVLILSKKYAPNITARIGISAFCIAVILLTVVGRLVSGVHWMTDIFAGILLGMALLAWYRVGLRWMKRFLKKIRTRKEV